jgi:hypothetical protein
MSDRPFSETDQAPTQRRDAGGRFESEPQSQPQPEHASELSPEPAHEFAPTSPFEPHAESEAPHPLQSPQPIYPEGSAPLYPPPQTYPPPADRPHDIPEPTDAPQPDLPPAPEDYDEHHVPMATGNHQHWLDEGWTIWDVIESGAIAVYRRLKPKERQDGQPIGPASP